MTAATPIPQSTLIAANAAPMAASTRNGSCGNTGRSDETPPSVCYSINGQNGHAPCGFRPPRQTRQYGSGCLPQLHADGPAVPHWFATSSRGIGYSDRACKGVWVPRVVVREGVGNTSTVRTRCDTGDIH